MGFDERLGWMLFGCVVGFILGYIVRYLREIKEELEEVEDIVKEKREQHRSSDDGFAIPQALKDVALLFVVILVAWSAFASQQASNKVKDNQQTIGRLVVCNQEYLSRTIRALNERTTYTIAQTQANVNLQKAQAEFFTLLLHKPPFAEAKRAEAANKYLSALTDFVELSSKTSQQAATYPFPTNDDFTNCFLNP